MHLSNCWVCLTSGPTGVKARRQAIPTHGRRINRKCEITQGEIDLTNLPEKGLVLQLTIWKTRAQQSKNSNKSTESKLFAILFYLEAPQMQQIFCTSNS